jgi:DNA-binding transcriptional MerR regulator
MPENEENKPERSTFPASWLSKLDQIPWILTIAALFVILLVGLALFKEGFNKDHALLSAPFLLFVGVVIVLWLFHAPLQKMLSRGSLTIKWGDKEIAIEDISRNFDKELSEKLAELSAEIEELKQHMEDLRGAGSKASAKTKTQSEPESVLDKICSAFHVASDDIAIMIYHLGSSRYEWRNVDTLARKTGFPVEKIESLSRQVPHIIVRGQGKTGNVLIGLTESAKITYARMK